MTWRKTRGLRRTRRRSRLRLIVAAAGWMSQAVSAVLESHGAACIGGFCTACQSGAAWALGAWWDLAARDQYHGCSHKVQRWPGMLAIRKATMRRGQGKCRGSHATQFVDHRSRVSHFYAWLLHAAAQYRRTHPQYNKGSVRRAPEDHWQQIANLSTPCYSGQHRISRRALQARYRGVMLQKLRQSLSRKHKASVASVDDGSRGDSGSCLRHFLPAAQVYAKGVDDSQRSSDYTLQCSLAPPQSCTPSPQHSRASSDGPSTVSAAHPGDTDSPWRPAAAAHGIERFTLLHELGRCSLTANALTALESCHLGHVGANSHRVLTGAAPAACSWRSRLQLGGKSLSSRFRCDHASGLMLCCESLRTSACAGVTRTSSSFRSVASPHACLVVNPLSLDRVNHGEVCFHAITGSNPVGGPSLHCHGASRERRSGSLHGADERPHGAPSALPTGVLARCERQCQLYQVGVQISLTFSTTSALFRIQSGAHDACRSLACPRRRRATSFSRCWWRWITAIAWASPTGTSRCATACACFGLVRSCACQAG